MTGRLDDLESRMRRLLAATGATDLMLADLIHETQSAPGAEAQEGK